MGTTNTSAKGGHYAARKRRNGAGGWVQVLLSLLLLADLFLLYTIIMQMTHLQKAFEASQTTNLILLGAFAVGAVILIYAVLRSKAWKRLLCISLACLIVYLVCCFSNIPFVKKYRDIWISTAMSTMRHQGLATYYIPNGVVQELLDREKAARDAQVGENTGDLTKEEQEREAWIRMISGGEDVEVTDENGKVEQLTPEQKTFYGLFYELDYASAEAWFRAHPQLLKNGYMKMLLDESGLHQEGTTIKTKLGERVLAIDAANQVLIVEVDCDGSRGVLAIAKDPSRLKLCPSGGIGRYGETAGVIAQRNGGILALTGSGFDDPNGVGNGGKIAGYAMCDGKEYHGDPFKWGYKRIELHEDNWFYITDTFKDVGKGTTDAMEFTPALLINGKKLDPSGWTGQNPRACIGQSKLGEILMLAVEGRRLDSPGCSVAICADVLLQHDCITALNCDGGTTAMLWFRGSPVMRCSNSAIPDGRHLPNAWVYVGD